MLKSFFTFLIVIVLTVICTTVILVARMFYRLHRHAKQFFRQAGDAMIRSEQYGLDIIPAGTIPPDPTWLLQSKQMLY